MSDERPAPGTEMIFQWRKWDGSPHWRHACVYLGSDQWGDWIGQPVGWHSFRPGASFNAEAPNVTLIPTTADTLWREVSPKSSHGDHLSHKVSAGAELPGATYALTVNRKHPNGMRIYIDLGWDVRWTEDPLLITGIDMDLDVIRVEGERGTWVDDRDEWAEHSIRYGYPADVMTHLEALTLDLEQRVRAQTAPFDNATADIWLDRLEALGLAH